MNSFNKDNFREMKFRRQQCRTKIVYPHILAAMSVCARLNRIQNQINPLTVYECLECGGLHVGHLAKEESILMYGAYSENVRDLQGISQ